MLRGFAKALAGDHETAQSLLADVQAQAVTLDDPRALVWASSAVSVAGDAGRALAYGVVSHVVPAASLTEEVEQFCRVLLGRPRPAILGLKEYLRVAPRMDDQGATDYARSLHSMVNTAAEMKRPRH